MGTICLGNRSTEHFGIGSGMDSHLLRGPGVEPLYTQIAELLRTRIDRDELRVGDRLDSEPRLSRELGVSRATVAKALELLVRGGYIERRQGQGTFVTRSPLERELPELTGFSEHIAGLGLPPGQRFLDYERTVVIEEAEDDLLSTFPAGTPIAVARRVRLVGGMPVGLHRTAVPAAIADRIEFTPEALRTERVSLYALFEQHGVVLARAEERLRACCADPIEAKLLETEPGTALMHVRRLSRSDDGTLVEAVDARYLGTFYDYRIDLVRTPMAHDSESVTGVRP